MEFMEGRDQMKVKENRIGLLVFDDLMVYLEGVK